VAAPRAVIAAPIYANSAHLREALESLLAQTFADFRLLLVDDASADDSVAVARAVAAADPRVEIVVNEARLGMLENTRRAYALSRELWPGADYWALASDHDVWEPRWLERLVGALDERPQAVLAYPLVARIDDDGELVRGPWRFDTEGIADPSARLRQALRRMISGDMIYGLFRADALAAVGSYKSVLAPDRLLLAELALRGEFVQVPELLWRRRGAAGGSLARQRRLFWPDRRPPGSSYLPWWLTHSLAFARAHGVRVTAGSFLAPSLAFQARAAVLNSAYRLVAPALKRWIATPRGSLLVESRVLPGVRLARDVLERFSGDAER
jgi:glycosyltransferase involved in cell wall biosynthesis